MNILKCICTWLAWALVCGKSKDINKNNSLNKTGNDYKLNFDSKWKFSSKGGVDGAVLHKNLPETPVSSEIEALVGGKVAIPCNMDVQEEGDHPYLVLLSRGSRPIYSIDARRGQSLLEALHWKATEESGVKKSRFLQGKSFVGFVLEGVQEKAAGDYFCRVDFGSSPTSIQRVRLHTIVPASHIDILTETQEKVQGTLGPFAVNSTIKLDCVVRGGTPNPNVAWYYNGKLIDSTIEESSDSVVVNRLTFTSVTKDHLHSTLLCKGNNSKLVKPLMSYVTIDVIIPPATVKILAPKNVVIEGVPVSFTCDTDGSRPSANISWWKNSFRLNDTTQFASEDHNTTRSIVTFIPKYEDDGAVLTCRSRNQLLSPMSVIEDSVRLTVNYAPRLTLLPGKRMNMSGLSEGDDVYMECNVVSLPKEDPVQWYHNEQRLIYSKNEGIIPSHNNLVLQNVQKDSSGEYTCRASNIVGSSKSNPIIVHIKYAPICSEGQQVIYGGGHRQLVNVSCTVESYPVPSSFRWAFNTSAEHVDIPEDLIQTEKFTSTVAYTPKNHLDYGSLLCWATNEKGVQGLPCVYQVVPASPPEAPTNCSVWDEIGTIGEVVVACKPGWDGGMSHKFSLEVRLQSGSKVLASLRNQPIPHFTVSGLAPGTKYMLSVLTSNSQGQAPPVLLTHVTPIDIAEKRLSASMVEEKEPPVKINLIPIIAGVSVSLVLLVIIIGLSVKIVLWKRHRRRSQSTNLSKTTESLMQSDSGKLHETESLVLVDSRASNITDEVILHEIRPPPDFDKPPLKPNERYCTKSCGNKHPSYMLPPFSDCIQQSIFTTNQNTKMHSLPKISTIPASGCPVVINPSSAYEECKSSMTPKNHPKISRNSRDTYSAGNNP